MDSKNFDQRNILLDEIINERRTHRKFKQEFPPEENIRSIINAGLHAPFAAAAVGNENEYFRKFFVLRACLKIKLDPTIEAGLTQLN